MSANLSDCIRDGSFPDSNELLTKEISSDDISTLLTSIAKSKDEIKNDIETVSQSYAGDVDDWIVQAKRLQDDIARCKIEARHIVEEHERSQTLRDTANEADSKVSLIEAEITFSKALEHEIQSMLEILQLLNEADHDILTKDAALAARKLTSVSSAIENISASQIKALLAQLDHDLRTRSQKILEAMIDSRWTVVRDETNVTLSAHSDASIQQSLSPDTPFTDTDTALSALEELQALSTVVTSVHRILESFIKSVLFSQSAKYPSAAIEDGENLTVTMSSDPRNTLNALAVLQTVLHFLHEKLPKHIRDKVAQEIIVKTIPALISSWLDPALPHELYELQELEPLRAKVSDLAGSLERYKWPGSAELKEWIDQIPRSWLAKRRMASLDAVRKAFTLARGILRPVERIERQTVSLNEPTKSKKGDDEDWGTAWDDESASDTKHKGDGDDDVSGWDFDTEENKSAIDKKGTVLGNEDQEDNAGDAWGWGDDDDTNEENEETKPLPAAKSQSINGEIASNPKSKEMVLTETYHITDVPDYVLESIGRDIADAHELENSPSGYFSNNSPATGLLGVPTLTLALFRAIAPTYYSLPAAKYTRPLTTINLYNDIQYLVQKLSESPDAAILEPSITSLIKFARQIYTSELDVQRTIITDLLDGAQGFERSTTFPNSQACADAISSTVDRLRHLHAEWACVLGESHLLQSLGSLMTMVFGKMTKDIEDLEDISEAESKQLIIYCQQVSALEDLFASQLPDLTHPDQESPTQGKSQILLYVPNYLRFQYLQQILESNLVEIKYLWAEGELSLEFSVDEVVDLIKALFAESQHRRGAIRDIKSSVVG